MTEKQRERIREQWLSFRFPVYPIFIRHYTTVNDSSLECSFLIRRRREGKFSGHALSLSSHFSHFKQMKKQNFFSSQIYHTETITSIFSRDFIISPFKDKENIYSKKQFQLSTNRMSRYELMIEETARMRYSV